MAQATPVKRNSFRGGFDFACDEIAAEKPRAICGCGGRSFREVHRVSQPNSVHFILYECEKCGGFSL
jgi:hypothetical protein